MKLLIVFIGSGIGGALRYAMGVAALRFMGPSFPWGTFVINVIGSALMGLAIGVFVARSATSAELRLFVATGLIGGFTTWSTFSLDTVTLWQRGAVLETVGYVAGSFVLSIAALLGTMQLARW